MEKSNISLLLKNLNFCVFMKYMLYKKGVKTEYIYLIWIMNLLTKLKNIYNQLDLYNL